MNIDVEVFENNVRNILRDDLHRINSVLYSTAETLRPGDFYFLGYNPGGKPGGECASKPNASCVIVPATSQFNDAWDWGEHRQEPGQHPMQRRARELFRMLGRDLDKVCASNLIFFQSRKESGVDYPRDAEACWKVHEYLIDEIVRPKVIITHGSRTYDFVRKRIREYSSFKQVEQATPDEDGERHWKCRALTSTVGKRLIIGLPHLSRFNPQNKNQTMEWMRMLVRRHARESGCDGGKHAAAGVVADGIRGGGGSG